MTESGNEEKKHKLSVRFVPVKIVLNNSKEVIIAYTLLAISAVTGLAFFGYIAQSFYDVYHFTIWLILVPLLVGLGILHGIDKTFGAIPLALLMFGLSGVLYAAVGYFAGPRLNIFIPLFYESLVFAFHVTSLYLAVYLITYKRLNLKFKVIKTGGGLDKFEDLLRNMGLIDDTQKHLKDAFKEDGESPL
jgi:hypothetical protein